MAHDGVGRVWIADAIAWLWEDLCSHGGRWRGAFNLGMAPPRDEIATIDLLGPDGTRWRDMIRPASGWLPAQVLHEASSPVARSEEETLTRLRLLVALDRACEGLNLIESRITPELAPLMDHWETHHGNLAKHADAVVLRKANREIPGGASLAHYLRNVTPLGQAARGAYEVRAVSVPERGRRLDRTRPLRVAFVPTLDEVDDVAFQPVRRGGALRFSVRLDAGKQARMAARMSDLITSMELDGVEVALFPETCAEASLVEALRQALFANHRACKRAPGLRLVFVGRLDSGAQENAVVVLSGAGQTLLVQRKQQPWRLNAFQQARYGLQDVLLEATRPVDRDEDILLSQPPMMCVLDDPGLGRIAILICEDLARCDPARRIATDVGPSYVIGPVMDFSLEPERWACKAAEALAGEPSAIVFIVNSSVLTLRHNRTHPAIAHDKVPGVGYVHHPFYEASKSLKLDLCAQTGLEDGIIRLAPGSRTFIALQIPPNPRA